MTNFARVVDGVAVDVSQNPDSDFHPDLASTFVKVPDSVVRGWRVTKGKWAAPDDAPAETPQIIYPPLTAMQFYLAFTTDERIAIKSSDDPVVKEFWATYELAVSLANSIDPNLPSIIAALKYLAMPKSAKPSGAGILASEDRIPQIRAGIPQ